MNESEFRDWARAQLRAMDDKIEALAKLKNAAPPPRPVEEYMRGEIEVLLATLTKKVREKKVAALAVAFVTDEGIPMTGFAADGGYFKLAGAATFIGLEILEAFRRREAAEAANENAETAA